MWARSPYISANTGVPGTSEVTHNNAHTQKNGCNIIFIDLFIFVPTVSRQGVAVTVIKAMTAVGCLKPKYPYLTVKTSALIYVAFYLKGKGNNRGMMPNYFRKLFKSTNSAAPINSIFLFFSFQPQKPNLH